MVSDQNAIFAVGPMQIRIKVLAVFGWLSHQYHAVSLFKAAQLLRSTAFYRSVFVVVVVEYVIPFPKVLQVLENLIKSH